MRICQLPRELFVLVLEACKLLRICTTEQGEEWAQAKRPVKPMEKRDQSAAYKIGETGNLEVHALLAASVAYIQAQTARSTNEEKGHQGP